MVHIVGSGVGGDVVGFCDTANNYGMNINKFANNDRIVQNQSLFRLAGLFHAEAIHSFATCFEPIVDSLFFQLQTTGKIWI